MRELKTGQIEKSKKKCAKFVQNTRVECPEHNHIIIMIFTFDTHA